MCSRRATHFVGRPYPTLAHHVGVCHGAWVDAHTVHRVPKVCDLHKQRRARVPQHRVRGADEQSVERLNAHHAQALGHRVQRVVEVGVHVGWNLVVKRPERLDAARSAAQQATAAAAAVAANPAAEQKARRRCSRATVLRVSADASHARSDGLLELAPLHQPHAHVLQVPPLHQRQVVHTTHA
jgi:hypothetical protein